MNYFFRVLIALDQLGNAAIGGMPDETISASAYRQNNKLAQRVINALFRDPEHCRDAYYSELGMRHLPDIYREISSGKQIN